MVKEVVLERAEYLVGKNVHLNKYFPEAGCQKLKEPLSAVRAARQSRQRRY